MTAPKMKHAGLRLKYIRMEKEWSQRELGTHLETFQANIARIESGVQDLTYKQLRLLNNLTGVNIHWLVTGQGEVMFDKQTTDKKLDKIISLLSKQTASKG